MQEQETNQTLSFNEQKNKLEDYIKTLDIILDNLSWNNEVEKINRKQTLITEWIKNNNFMTEVLEKRINLFIKQEQETSMNQKETYENTLKECLDLLFFDMNISDIDMNKIKTKIKSYFTNLYLDNESKVNIEKTLHNLDQSGTKTNVSDLVVFGNTDMFQLLCKASSKKEGWMKSTKALHIDNVGCLVQVSTQQRNPDGSYALAEALSFVPRVDILTETDEEGKLIGKNIALSAGWNN